MKITSPVLDEIDIVEENIIYFPEGLPAFEDQRRFVIIPMDKEDGPFFYLQAVDKEELCFITANPFLLFPRYEIELGQEEMGKLQLAEDDKNIHLLTILTIPDDFKKTTANLLGPVVINAKKKLGFQFIPASSDYTTRHFIFPQEEPGKIKPASEKGL